MVRDPERLPEGIESELAWILDGPHALIEARLKELCRREPEHALAVHAWVERARAATDGSTVAPDEERVESTWSAERLARLEALRPRELDRYRIEGRVAKGGMGAIFRVRDEDLGRPLAMKLILGQDSSAAGGETPALDPRLLERFLDEAQVTGQLDHPGVVPVHELGVDHQGKVFFTMRLVRGRTADEVFQLARDGREGWTRTRALEVFLKICDTMAFAHAKGVLHRDLKPANVMVGRFGEVYVMDWGLAKVMGQQDRRDIRLRPQDPASLSKVRTDRAREAESDPDSPLLTMDGAVVGTPSYMPPEQAEGRVDELLPQADVYAVGAMLYQLLTGWRPYVKLGARLSPYTVLHAVIDGPPKPVHQIDGTVPAELVAICEKAMARDASARYHDMTALAADLRAYLEQRVVAAYRTGAVAEMRAWVRRNKPLATSLAAAFVLAIGAAVGMGALARVAASNAARAEQNSDEANRQRTLADQKAVEAERNANLLADKVREFDQLAGVVHLRTALDSEKALYPAEPDRIEAMRIWLRRDAARLEKTKRELTQALVDLRRRAQEPTDDERRADRERHPDYDALQQMTAKVGALRSAQAARQGGDAVPIPTLPNALRAKSAAELNEVAWSLVNPDDESGRKWDQLGAGVTCAEAALEKVGAGDASFPRYRVLDTLAWAHLLVGRDEAAIRSSAEALAAAPPGKKEEFRARLAKLQKAAAAAGEHLATAEKKHAALAASVSQRRTWTFLEPSQRFLHDTLSDLQRDIEAFERTEWAAVRRRLAWAERTEELTLRHPNARVTWAQARAAIRAADGVVASTEYGKHRFAGHPIELKPQWGLVPIGMNPVTKLWEFYHLRSAWQLSEGVESALRLPVPAHDPATGAIEVGVDTGIVFVLVPGGTFDMGAQKTDPNGVNYDPLARGDEKPTHSVTLAPFFIARHELTQGQWLRLHGDNPSRYGVGFKGRGIDTPVTLAHPVELDWTMSERVLRAHGLVLPTEAQWEYACRADSKTRWSSGEDVTSLKGWANMLDRRARRYTPWPGDPLPWDDGFVVHAPVGSLKANGFGLFDMHGNVWEWCLDNYVWYTTPPSPGDGFRDGPSTSGRVNRGGNFFRGPGFARVSLRQVYAPSNRSYDLGARAARALR